MKKIFLVIALGMMSACAMVPGPAVYANKTVLDEKAMLTAEIAYKAETVVIQTGVDAGVIKGPLAAKIAVIDNKAYLALLSARAAYAAGNSAGFAEAVGNAQAAVVELKGILK